MSILIKGIDLPKDRKPYAIEVTYRFEGADGLFSEKIYLSPNQAIQIPTPHGRLIDADKVFCYDFMDEQNIDNAPTIIEAEE